MDHNQTAYHIPLSDANLIDLGMLSVIWASMDFNLVFVLSKLSGTTMKDMVTLLDRVPAPAKVARFKKLSAFLVDEHAKSIAVDFCRKHAGVLTIRNHLTHGFWGLYSADGVKKYATACYFPENTKA